MVNLAIQTHNTSQDQKLPFGFLCCNNWCVLFIYQFHLLFVFLSQAQGNSYCTNSEDKDTDALIDNEPDQPNEACEPTAEIDR